MGSRQKKMLLTASRFFSSDWGMVSMLGFLLTGLMGSRLFAFEAPPEGVTTDCESVHVVDGDTVDVRVSYILRVRLLDCWSPESRTLNLDEKQRGIAASKYMESLAEEHPKVRLHVPGGNSLADILTFGRILGRIWRLNDRGEPERRDLSELMVRAGHATRRRPSK